MIQQNRLNGRTVPAVPGEWTLATRAGCIMKRIGEHAVVIGGSMAGLLAARALADFYGNVTVLERDAFPVADIPRKGVPQGKHAHGLLARGRTVIEELFPGWTDAVVGCGGVRGDIANDVNWLGHGVTIKSAPSDMVGLLAARPVLEGHVRRRLLALPNVRAIEHCAVLGLVADETHSAIRGVRGKIDNGVEETILADLVVDASGRGSATPAWLESFGFPRPEEEKIEIGIGYIVSIGGYFGDHAPDDNRMFAAYAGSLPTPDIHDIVAHAEPLTDFVTYRYPANLRRRYERLRRFPKNYLVFGDAMCSFNPVYGQGMTVAAQEAALLQACLRDGEANLARRFFKVAKAAIDVPWDIAVGNDLRHPQVQGPRSPKVRFINWYIGKLHMAARGDAVLANAFLKVANLTMAPTGLLNPLILTRVLWGNITQRSRMDAASSLERAG